MKLYRRKYRPMEKLAGTNIPSDPKLWSAEVLKSLVSQHPYVDASETKIVFSRIEPETKATTGKIIIKSKCAIPFTIRPNEKTKKLELDPLDIIFNGKMFKSLNESSLRESIEGNEVGKAHGRNDYGTLPSGNQYIGDMTGDVTPLEYSGYPSSHAGPRMMNTAGSGLLSVVVRNSNDLSSLESFLGTYSGINSLVQNTGLSDSLDVLRTGMTEGIQKQSLAHIMRRKDGSFAVAFPNGDTRVTSANDLKSVLGADFTPCMRQVMQRGWCMVRDFATLKSVEQPLKDTIPSPIKTSGRYRLIDVLGKARYGQVFSQMTDFDGQNINCQKVVLDDGTYTEGKAIVGVEVTGSAASFPIGVIDTGVTGFFVDESFLASATPNVKINKIISFPGEPDMIIGTKGMGTPIGLVLVEGLNKPQEIPRDHYDPVVMPSESYYIPAHMSFVQVSGKCSLVDRAGLQKEAESRPKATLRKNANRYYLNGNTHNGQVNYQFMPEEEMRTKLAWYGADDHVIQLACDMSEEESKDLWGLTHPVRLKKASKEKIKMNPRYYTLIKRAANEAAQGMDETAQTQDPVEDPAILDSILSLQFVNDDTLEDIIESKNLFIETEDRLAKLLLAARQGEDSIHEKGVQKALKGIGEARKSLKTLEIELESRNA